MPKTSGTVKLSGKSKKEGIVYVQTKNGGHTRSAQKPGSHRDEPALKENYLSVGYVNAITGSVNRLIKLYGKEMIVKGFFKSLLSAVWKVKNEKRIAALASLKDLEAHPYFSFNKIIQNVIIDVKKEKNNLKINLGISTAAQLKKPNKFYFLQLIVGWWSDDKTFHHEAHRTEWLDESSPLPAGWTLNFKKPKDADDFMILCCCAAGEKANEKTFPPDRHLKIIDVGSYSKKSIAELKEYRERKKVVAKEEEAEEEEVFVTRVR